MGIWRRELRIPCGYNYGEIEVWGRVPIWLSIVKPSPLGVGFWGLQYMCLSQLGLM